MFFSLLLLSTAENTEGDVTDDTTNVAGNTAEGDDDEVAAGSDLAARSAVDADDTADINGLRVNTDHRVHKTSGGSPHSSVWWHLTRLGLPGLFFLFSLH